MNPIKTSWRCKPGQRGGATGREEPFSELWDQAPDAVMHLLRHSRSAEVQRFALRIWRANPSFIDEADGGLVADLLGSWFAETVGLGLDIAKAKWDAGAPDSKLLLAMLDSVSDEARAQGMTWLRGASGHLVADAGFQSAVGFLDHEDGRTGVREVLRSMPLEKPVREGIVARALSGMLAQDDESVAGRAGDWLEFIAAEKIAALPDEPMAVLAGHWLEACQLLAVRILLKRQSLVGLPEPLLMAALSSEHAPERALGMELLGRLGDDELAKRVETLAACAVFRHEEIREVAGLLLTRAAGVDRQAARQLVSQWWPLLFRREDFEGLHAAVYQTLTGSFAAELGVIPAGSFRRMLESKYSYGQDLGFVLLQREITCPDPADAVAWAVHPLAALREWARDHLDAEALRADPARVLVLLESPYDDSREWAFGFCRRILKDGDWSAEALVALCDSNQPEVRAFGRELVTRLFREEDGPLYLARLSQHPTAEVQLFATNYLERFATGRTERIAALELYFRTVLSRIGAGRVTKRRVLAFLEKEALADPEVAESVTSLLGRQVGTVAIQDRAEMIRILDALRRAWPDLKGPLLVKPVAIYQAS